MRKYRILLATTASAFATIASAQTAQTGTAPAAPPGTVPGVTAQTPDSAPVAAPASAATASPEQAEGISDIIVTATRREERLQRIPVTVTAVSGAALATGGVTDTRGLTAVVPGLTMTRAASVGQPVIRGVGSTGTSGGDESNVATYIDGVYQADPYATIIELVNVQRVEVLRGPQGTVFGRNATGGLINIITPDPSFTTKGAITATYARMRNNANGGDVRGYVTGPLGDKVAADFSGLYRRDDGYVRNLVTGGTYGRNEVYTVRGKLMYNPYPGSKIILTGDYARQDGQGVVNQPIGSFTRGKNFAGVIIPTGPWQAALDVEPVVNYRRFSTSLRTSFDLKFANLETTSAYVFSKAIQALDSDTTNIRIAAAFPTFTTRTYSQEVRLLSNPGRFTWLTGLYAFHLNNSAYVALSTSPAPPGPFSTNVLEPELRTTSYAGFIEGTYEIVPKLFLTAGGRYTTERRSLTQVVNGRLTVDDASRRYNQATYRAALRYQATDQTSLYGSYGTGFKSGVFNGVATVLNVVDPEKIKAAEVGVKSDPARWLRTNVSAYHYNYTNLQVTARDQSGSGAFILQNAATAKIYGGEFEATVAPVRDVTVSGSVAYIHARYENFLGAQAFLPLPSGANQAVAVNASGNTLVRAPKLTFNISPRWRHELDKGAIELSANLFHSTRVYWDFPNTPAFSQKPYTLVTAGVGYELDRWRFDLAATNLFDEVVAQQIRTGAQGSDRVLERPRRVTVSARYSF